MMMDDKLKKIVKTIDNLPTLPLVVNKILQVVDSSRTAAKDLAEILSKDHSLTAKILKLVNSAFYGFPRKITSINHGVIILGFHTIKHLAIGASTFKSIGKWGFKGFLKPERFWEHSLACGICARRIAAKLKYPVPEEAFVAGLLHDMGKLVLNQGLFEDYQKTISCSREEKINLFEAEKKLLGVSHAMMGAWLSEEWKFPGTLTHAIAYHHNPPFQSKRLSQEDLTLITMVYIADIVCKRRGYLLYDGDVVPLVDSKAIKFINLKPDELETVSEEIVKELEEIKASFGMEKD